MTKKIVDECTPESLTLEGIRKRAKAFNWMFERNGGYKTYEGQAIDVLLKEIENLEREVEAWRNKPMAEQLREQTREVVKLRALNAHLRDTMR